MNKIKPYYFFITFALLLFISGCNVNNILGPIANSPFSNGSRVLFDGYTYTDNFGNNIRNLNVNFHSIGQVSSTTNETVYGIIDSTFSYDPTSQTQGYLIRTDTLYFGTKTNNDISYLSYGYYFIYPTWVDLFRFSELGNSNAVTYYQNFDQNFNGQRWKLNLTSTLSRTTIQTNFGSVQGYRLDQTLDYDYPQDITYNFVWFWSEKYGVLAYDEQRQGFIKQIARSTNIP